jgi:hypothetical protein
LRRDAACFRAFAEEARWGLPSLEVIRTSWHKRSLLTNIGFIVEFWFHNVVITTFDDHTTIRK